MVKPFRSLAATHLGLACVLVFAGCAVVPRSKLDESRRLSRTLQADNARLKNSVTSLKSQYEELAERSDDDAFRLRNQEQEIQKLLASVHAYQEDREQLARGVERLKNQVRGATRPISAQFRTRFENFAKENPGCEFDPKSSIVTIPTELLFQPGTDKPKAKARDLLASFSKVFDDPDAAELRILVTGHTEDSLVTRTSYEGDAPKAEHLSLDRASKVRELIASEGHIATSRIDVAGVAASDAMGTDVGDGSLNSKRRIEIQVSRSGALPPETPSEP
ncbi:OmpA family protein [Singulisphaera sp. PoT]|uniref:OmpA family protein n=1 Tax=Singulisphaera sp. PoT TaxID=3411797 RepID=UPI003BF4BFC9